eukprot:350777-Chlamydomonas_euryale.AAC.5
MLAALPRTVRCHAQDRRCHAQGLLMLNPIQSACAATHSSCLRLCALSMSAVDACTRLSACACMGTRQTSRTCMYAPLAGALAAGGGQ